MKNVFLALVLFCVAALADAAEEIRVWHGMEGHIAAEFNGLVARFNASQDQYRVVAEFQPYNEATVAELKGFKTLAPHIVQVPEASTADMLKSGAALPLWQVVEQADVRIDPRHLKTVAGYFSDAEGRLLALPFNVSTVVLYYNRDAFRRAKLDPDRPPRTWYEMPTALAALVESGQACAYTTAWPAWVLLENMSTWHNQAFATERNGMAGSDPRLAFNTRLMVRWISMLSSWHKAGYFTYAGRGNEAEARFASGECALLTSSSASYEDLRSASRFDLGVAQLPYYDDFDGAPQNTLVRGSSLWVLGSRTPAEYRGVALFLAYVASIDVQARWHQRTGFVPTTASAYELTRRLGFYRSHPVHEVALRQLLDREPTEATRGIRIGALLRIRAIVNEELEAVWSGAKAPLDALDAAVHRGNALLEAKAASR